MTASNIRDAHTQNQLMVTHATEPVEGSARYQAPQFPGRGGHPDAGKHGRGGRCG
ncbi:hypothetical protein M378DRAFT_173730 [Amanita muscaria Koide BX008]|uniref:Uncharacterized protein n=1 Tax=Amanita muscaria (strain Koide BX008) TaxID=946122 RepID=A0A0C2RY97_AMAMK|nr:hypothetical protein M378DRAFT_173730 [Amanita muscaria Koide BX008]